VTKSERVSRPPHRITFGDLRIGATGRRLLTEALDRQWVSEGPNVAAFERNFAAHFGYAHAVATSSGTDAGIVTWAALASRHGWSRGDEVITPAAAFVATGNAVLAAGLTPVFVDVDLHTLNLNPALIEAAITPRTRAIQAVHTMGRICDMDAIAAIAAQHGLVVAEDACEAHGASRNGALVGTCGAAAFFSFYAAHLICSGEGGMIVTADPELDALCRSVRSHGRRNGELFFAFDRFGVNAKMNDMEAAIGLDGLEHFDDTFTRRRAIVSALRTRLARWSDRVLLPDEAPGEVVSPHAFPLVLRDASADIAGLYEHLESASIQCKTLFGSLPTQHGAFRFLGHALGCFPIAERLHTTGLHFGVHQFLSDEDVEYIADTIDGYFATH
jgi:dTDP-4-amino-4,6-dideoxygalactose transaminase